jgi:hypothetical protein
VFVEADFFSQCKRFAELVGKAGDHFVHSICMWRMEIYELETGNRGRRAKVGGFGIIGTEQQTHLR